MKDHLQEMRDAIREQWRSAPSSDPTLFDETNKVLFQTVVELASFEDWYNEEAAKFELPQVARLGRHIKARAFAVGVGVGVVVGFTLAPLFA